MRDKITVILFVLIAVVLEIGFWSKKLIYPVSFIVLLIVLLFVLAM